MRAGRICAQPGCDVIVYRGSRCAAHAECFHQQDYRRWYQTQRWREIRADQLRREPWCVECAAQGQMVQATDVDHVTPHRGSEALFYGGPFQSLCHSHHSTKTQRELQSRGVG